MHADESPLPLQDFNDAAPTRSHRPVPDERAPRRAGDPNSITDEEILTYDEAAQLLKVSARTLERWTREGLVPYIRLPQRGRWSGVRFSRDQLLRWLQQRTVRAR